MGLRVSDELLFIRGPALPSVVSGLLTADGKAGPRMKKMVRGDTRCFSRRGMRHVVGRMSSSVRVKHLGERRTRKPVRPLTLARVEYHHEEADVGVLAAITKCVSHSVCSPAPERSDS